MSFLAPLPESAFAASYEAKSQTLTLTAKGSIAGWILSHFFQREIWAGGLKYSLRTYAGGGDSPQEHEIDVSYEEHIAQPAPYFNSKLVLIETGSGTYDIVIDYNGFIPPPEVTQDNTVVTTAERSPNGSIIGDVLPPIKKYLPGGQTLKISVHIATGDPRSTVVANFNP